MITRAILRLGLKTPDGLLQNCQPLRIGMNEDLSSSRIRLDVQKMIRLKGFIYGNRRRKSSPRLSREELHDFNRQWLIEEAYRNLLGVI